MKVFHEWAKVWYLFFHQACFHNYRQAPIFCQGSLCFKIKYIIHQMFPLSMWGLVITWEGDKTSLLHGSKITRAWTSRWPCVWKATRPHCALAFRCCSEVTGQGGGGSGVSRWSVSTFDLIISVVWKWKSARHWRNSLLFVCFFYFFFSFSVIILTNVTIHITRLEVTLPMFPPGRDWRWLSS